jgi:polysaccharide export outer membrane protein
VLWLAIGSLAFAQGAGAPAADIAPSDSQSYRIGPEDVLQIAVWRNEALSRSVKVRPDGMISLPLVNDVRAAGLTPMELRAVLMDKLNEQLPDPEVSVMVVEIHSFKVSVIGEVAKPALYELKSSTTVLDVLAAAGGFTQQAARSEIVILRREGGAVKRIPFDYNRVTAPGGAAGNIHLQPGDIVVVP